MTRNKKFSAILAVLVVGFLSIYAVLPTFNSTNQTQSQLNVTLNMQLGAQIPVSIAPGQTVPTQLNGDQVVAITMGAAQIPVGINAVVVTPNGNVDVVWQMAGGQALGVAGVPDNGELS